MKIYITKYALSKGILEADAVISDTNPDMAVVKTKGYGYDRYFHSTEWFAGYKEALANARDRKRRKLLSLSRQIKRLEGTEFTETKPL